MSSDWVKQGWLYKSPPDRRLYKDKWHWRYFVLRQGELPFQYFLDYYFTKRRFWKKGTIELDRCLRLDADFSFVTTKGKKLDHAFSLVTANRIYYLAARTEQDMDEWVEAICHSMGMKEDPTVTDGVRSYPVQLQVSNARMSFRQPKDRNRQEKSASTNGVIEGASGSAEVGARLSGSDDRSMQQVPSNGLVQNAPQPARHTPSSPGNPPYTVLPSPKPVAEQPGAPVPGCPSTPPASSQSHSNPYAEPYVEASPLQRMNSGPRRPPPRPVLQVEADDDEYQVPRDENESPPPLWAPPEKPRTVGPPRATDTPPRREPPPPPRLDAVIPPASTSSFQEEDYDIPPTSPHLDNEALYQNAGEMSPHSAGEGYVNVFEETRVTHKTEARRSYVKSASSPPKAGAKPSPKAAGKPSPKASAKPSPKNKVQYLDLDLETKAPTPSRLDSDDHSPYKHIDFVRTHALDETLRHGRMDKQASKETK